MFCEPNPIGRSALPAFLRSAGTLLQRLTGRGVERRDVASEEEFHSADDGFLALDDVACVRIRRG